MAVLDKSLAQLALIMDEQQRLLGLLTDGDIRRALLAGRKLEESIETLYTRDFYRVDGSAGRAEILELMHSRELRHIPIVEDERLVGMHLWTQMLTRQTRPNWVCILAGGRGTRLYPLTQNVPKPMLPVAGRPILERIILHLMGHGLHRFYLSISHLGHLIRQHFGDGNAMGCEILYLEESQPLGTAGPLGLIQEDLEHPLLVMNGDLVTQFNAGQMLDFHQAGQNSVTIASRLYHHKVPFGCLSIRDGQVLDIEEKPVILKSISAGIYVLQPETLKLIPSGQDFPMTGLIGQLIEKEHRVASFELSDDWIDVGQVEELNRARGGAYHD